MGENNIVLKIKSLSKHFGALKAVDNVSFDVKKGEILGLIGPNGAGKTTVTNLVNGAYTKTTGKVFFKDSDVSTLKPYQIAKMGLTRTYQVVKPLLGMTVEENVLVGSLFGRGNRDSSMKNATKRAGEILKLVGLEKKKDSLVSDITLPDLKKMEFARVLAMEPEVVLHHGKKIVEGTPQKVINDQAVIEAYLGKRYAKGIKEVQQ